MKRSISFLFALGVLVIAVPTFAAAVGTGGTLGVSATVITNCVVTTTPVAFGNYDPVGAQAVAGTNDLTATGQITVNCTRGANALRVDLDNGVANTSPRQMTNGTDNLNYDLFKTTTYTAANRWSTGAAGGVTLPAFASAATGQTLDVFGFLPAGQDVSAGSYADTVGVTINN